jgi:hypothetical protein
MRLLRRFFGIFGLQTLPEPTPGELRAALDTLKREIEAQRAAHDALRVEWAEMLSKLNRWSQREAARLRRDTQANIDTPGEEPIETAPTNGGGASKADLWRAFRQGRGR